MSKKIFSIVLVLCFAMNLAVSAQFADIEGHWAQAALEKWNEKGIIMGYDDNTICPDNNITAAELCSLLNRLLGVEQGEVSSFTDVSAEAWYYGDVAGAEAAGYIDSTEGTSFYPDAAIRRGRAAQIISRAFMLTPDTAVDALPFTDVDVSNAYYDAIKTMYVNNLILGKTEIQFAPEDYLTRAEVVTMFDNIIQQYHNDYTDIEEQQIEGSLLITKPNIVIKNTTVNGNLFISRGVSGGELRLDNVTVTGKVYYCGTNGNVLIFKNTNAENMVADTNDARIILYQNSTVDNLESYGTVMLSEIFATGAGYRSVIQAGDGTLSVAGRVQSCQINETAILNVLPDGDMAEVTIAAAAKDTVVVSEGNLDKIVNNATSITVNDANKTSGTITNITAVTTEEADKIYVASLSAGSTRPKNSYDVYSGFTSSGDNSIYLTGLAIQELESTGVKSFTPAFAADVFAYEMIVKNTIDRLNIMPSTSKLQASVKINEKTASTDDYNSIDIPVGESTVTIDLYLGLSKKCTYTIKVNRLDPLDPAIMEKINTDTENITVDDLEAIGIDGVVPQQMEEYKAAIIERISEKGTDLTDDEIQSIINECNESVAEIQGLTVTNSTVYTNGYNLMLHDFSTEQTEYMVYVDKRIADVDIYFEALHTDADVKINGNEAKSGEANRVSGLREGENEIDIAITSANGENSKTYTIIVDKDSGSSIIENSNFGNGAAGWSLGKSAPANGELNLEQNPGWMTVVRKAPGDAMWQLGIKSATFNVPSATTVTIEFLASTVDGVDGVVDRTINVMRKVGSGVEMSAISGNNTGNVDLVNGQEASYSFSTGGSASDGMTTCYIYIQTGNSKDGDEADVKFKYIRISYEGADGSLKTLNVVGGGTPVDLTPAFSPDITEYRAAVDNAVAQLIVTAEGQNANTVVKVNGETAALHFVPLQTGLNTIQVEGTSPTGNVKTYTIEITREE